MSKSFEQWALIWLFCIALGTCSGPKPKVNVTVEQCDGATQIIKK